MKASHAILLLSVVIGAICGAFSGKYPRSEDGHMGGIQGAAIGVIVSGLLILWLA